MCSKYSIFITLCDVIFLKISFSHFYQSFRVFLRVCIFIKRILYSKIWFFWSVCVIDVQCLFWHLPRALFAFPNVRWLRVHVTAARASWSRLSDVAVFWPPCNWLLCVKWSSEDWWQWLAGSTRKCCALSLVWVMFRARDISGVNSAPEQRMISWRHSRFW